nr:hypothetical protein [Tanacetum cinerariifolium]
ALSPVRADLLPPCKRVRDFGFVTVIEDSYEPYTELDVDFNIQVDIDACIAFANDLRARRTDDRVVVETAVEGEVIESAQREQGHRIMATNQQSAAMSERISTLERDNMRLRGMLGVER